MCINNFVCVVAVMILILWTSNLGRWNKGKFIESQTYAENTNFVTSELQNFFVSSDEFNG